MKRQTVEEFLTERFGEDYVHSKILVRSSISNYSRNCIDSDLCSLFNIQKEEIKEKKDMNVLGKEIPRVSKEVIEYLLKVGILYIGDDGQLHVIESK